MMLRQSLRNPILLQILTLRILCATLSLHNVGRRGLARKRSPRSTRMKHLRRDEHGRNARRKRRRRKKSCKERRTPCAAWRNCSSPWEVQEKTIKGNLRGGAEAEVLRRLGVTVVGRCAVGPPNHIPLVHVGEVQADPGLHGGKNSYGFCRVTSAVVPGPTLLRIFKGLCCVIEYTGTRVHVGTRVHLNSLKVFRTSLLSLIPSEKPFSLTLADSCIPTRAKGFVKVYSILPRQRDLVASYTPCGLPGLHTFPSSRWTNLWVSSLAEPHGTSLSVERNIHHSNSYLWNVTRTSRRLDSEFAKSVRPSSYFSPFSAMILRSRENPAVPDFHTYIVLPR